MLAGSSVDCAASKVLAPAFATACEYARATAARVAHPVGTANEMTGRRVAEAVGSIDGKALREGEGEGGCGLALAERVKERDLLAVAVPLAVALAVRVAEDVLLLVLLLVRLSVGEALGERVELGARVPVGVPVACRRR